MRKLRILFAKAIQTIRTKRGFKGSQASLLTARKFVHWTCQTTENCRTYSLAGNRSRKWNPSELPKWLDEDFYLRKILPALSRLTMKSIRTAIDVSRPYALIRRGERTPHFRHWLPLAILAGIKN
jgi:hypothetical protein